MKKLVLSIVLVNLLAACASEKPKAPEAAAPVPPPVVTAPAPEAAPAPAPVVEVDSLNDPASILAKRSVYYPFDVSAVQDADKPIVVAHAKYLSRSEEHTSELQSPC